MYTNRLNGECDRRDAAMIINQAERRGGALRAA